MARELVQLTFIKLWQFRHTLSTDLPLDAQLFTIATSTLIDYLRGQNTLRKRIATMPENTDGMLNLTTAGAERTFENDDYLQAVIRLLSPVRKKVFILSRIYGHSYKDIAHELSISVKTVEDHMVKALKHIRTIMQSLLLLAVFFLLY